MPPAIAYFARCGMGPLVDVVVDSRTATTGGTRSPSGRGRPRRSASGTARTRRNIRRPRIATTRTTISHRSSLSRRPPGSRSSALRAVGPDRAGHDLRDAATRWRRPRRTTAARSTSGHRRPEPRRRPPAPARASRPPSRGPALAGCRGADPGGRRPPVRPAAALGPTPAPRPAIVTNGSDTRPASSDAASRTRRRGAGRRPTAPRPGSARR